MMRKNLIPLVTLFFSLSTLICCALPALFVMLGAGAVFVSVLGVFPQLIWFSEHKTLIFIISGALLVLNAFSRAALGAACPTDPQGAEACRRARALSTVVLYISTGAFFVGAFFAFVAPRLWAS